MTRPPRVLMLAPHLDRVGGYELQALSLSRALVRRGISVWIVSDNIWNLAAREGRDGVLIYRLSPPSSPWWRQPRLPWMVPDREADLSVFLRQHRTRYDAVHAHAFCPPCDAAMKSGHRLGKPTLVKVATEGDPTEISTGNTEMRRIWRGLMHADQFLCISQAIVSEFRGLGVSPRKLIHVPNGVDTSQFRPPDPAERRALRAAFGLEERTSAFVYVGRLADRKAVDVLLRAWATLPSHRREGALLCIVGDGEQSDALRALTVDLEIETSVRFLGERRDVADLLRAADGFVFPSRREGLSNAVLEAMASGLCVLATRIGGNVDLIAEGETGLLCNVDDPEDLSRSLDRMIEDYELRQRLATAAYERVQSTYTFERVVERLLPLYGIAAPPVNRTVAVDYAA